MAKVEQEVIVKKKYVPADTHHGGAWKVAYADFVTAMMAFFLLLWLLNATEQEVLDGISNYFTPNTATSSGSSGAGGLFGGVTPNDPGPTKDQEQDATLDSESTATGELQSVDPGQGKEQERSTGSEGEVDYEQEEKSFNTTKRLLERSMDQLPPELSDLKETLKVDVSEEGLRIQLVDNREKSGFRAGTAELTKHARQALKLIGQYIERLPNPIAITGHTDSSGDEARNWKLSIARANSTRRELARLGLPDQRFETVIGKADTELLIPEEPASPQNRRMTILLLRRAEVPGDGLRPPAIIDQN